MRYNINFRLLAVMAIIMVANSVKANTGSNEGNEFIGKYSKTINPHSKLTPELLWAMGRVGSYDASEETGKIVYNVSYYSIEQNKSHTVIYISDIDGKDCKLLTTSKSSESAPKFINNGKQISFLAADDNGTSQIWLMNTDGSNRKKISNSETDIEDYIFSPDESKVVVVRSIKSKDGVSDIYPDLPKSSGIIVNDLMYRHWDEWVETIPHIYVADFTNGQVTGYVDVIGETQLFECPMKPFGGIEQVAWSHDSKTIAYTCRKKTGRDYAVSTDSDIFMYDTQTKTTKNLCKPANYSSPAIDYTLSLKNQEVNKQSKDVNAGYDTNPAFSPDGKYVAWQSMERDGYESDRNRLCVYNLETGAKSYVTEKFDSNVDAFCWSKDSKTIYFTGVWHGETHIYTANLKGETKRITSGQYDYTSITPYGKDLVCSRQSMQKPTELYYLNTKTKKIKQITNENKLFYDNIDWGDVKPRWTKTTDGKDMLSWVILPPNFDETKAYPTLLFCEGGPQSPVSQFWSYRWNMQIMAANGYIVIAPNRRGLPGFGSVWNEQISTNYGGQCMQDLLTAIDDFSKESYVDKDKLGCVGASFGGYSVYYLAGNHEKRFKCFIAHDGIFNLEQQYLETEEDWFTNWDLGGAFWHKDRVEDIKRSYSASPHNFVNNWDTPILCIHGEKDYRIVASQAMAAFNAARLKGVPAQLLIFPDENHWVLKPQNGILWQRTFFGWLDKWLK